jgi:hypothetical protein
MKHSRSSFATTGVAGLTLAIVVVLFSFGVPERQGCGGNGEPPAAMADDESDMAASVCAQQHAGRSHDGEPVIVCDKAYGGPPQVKLPADSSSVFYLALQTSGRLTLFIDRSGVEYGVENTLPATLKLPSNRSLYFIYKVAGTIGTMNDPISNQVIPSINVKAAKPYILLSAQAIDSSVTVWEGTVARRLSDSSWDPNTSVPLRITIRSQDAARGLPVWGDTSKLLADGPVSELVGAIDNWSQNVQGSDGHCLQSLTAMGRSNPFAGARSGDVRLFRMATMHFAGDQVMVLEYPPGTTGLSQSGMGGITVLHPAAFIQTARDPRWHVQELRPHSAPDGNVVSLHPASGGGGGC